MGRRPPIVTICGSTRFKKEIQEAAARLTLRGWIVLGPELFGHSGDLSTDECERGHPTKDMLDELHKRKIDLSDEVFIVDPGGYVGESTAEEIEYAKDRGVPVSYRSRAEEWEARNAE